MDSVVQQTVFENAQIPLDILKCKNPVIRVYPGVCTCFNVNSLIDGNLPNVTWHSSKHVHVDQNTGICTAFVPQENRSNAANFTLNEFLLITYSWSVRPVPLTLEIHSPPAKTRIVKTNESLSMDYDWFILDEIRYDTKSIESTANYTITKGSLSFTRAGNYEILICLFGTQYDACVAVYDCEREVSVLANPRNEVIDGCLTKFRLVSELPRKLIFEPYSEELLENMGIRDAVITRPEISFTRATTADKIYDFHTVESCMPFCNERFFYAPVGEFPHIYANAFWQNSYIVEMPKIDLTRIIHTYSVKLAQNGRQITVEATVLLHDATNIDRDSFVYRPVHSLPQSEIVSGIGSSKANVILVKTNQGEYVNYADNCIYTVVPEFEVPKIVYTDMKEFDTSQWNTPYVKFNSIILAGTHNEVKYTELGICKTARITVAMNEKIRALRATLIPHTAPYIENIRLFVADVLEKEEHSASTCTVGSCMFTAFGGTFSLKSSADTVYIEPTPGAVIVATLSGMIITFLPYSDETYVSMSLASTQVLPTPMAADMTLLVNDVTVQSLYDGIQWTISVPFSNYITAAPNNSISVSDDFFKSVRTNYETHIEYGVKILDGSTTVYEMTKFYVLRFRAMLVESLLTVLTPTRGISIVDGVIQLPTDTSDAIPYRMTSVLYAKDPSGVLSALVLVIPHWSKSIPTVVVSDLVTQTNIKDFNTSEVFDVDGSKLTVNLNISGLLELVVPPTGRTANFIITLKNAPMTLNINNALFAKLTRNQINVYGNTGPTCIAVLSPDEIPIYQLVTETPYESCSGQLYYNEVLKHVGIYSNPRIEKVAINQIILQPSEYYEYSVQQKTIISIAIRTSSCVVSVNVNLRPMTRVSCDNSYPTPGPTPATHRVVDGDKNREDLVFYFNSYDVPRFGPGMKPPVDVKIDFEKGTFDSRGITGIVSFIAEGYMADTPGILARIACNVFTSIPVSNVFTRINVAEPLLLDDYDEIHNFNVVFGKGSIVTSQLFYDTPGKHILHAVSTTYHVIHIEVV